MAKIPCMEAIKIGVCHADCCGIVPINSMLFESLKGHVVVAPTKLVSIRDFVIPICDDVQCPFLKRKTLSCAIYDQRPVVCQHYGNADLPCPYYDETGNLRTRADRRRQMSQINSQIDYLMQKALAARHGTE